MNAIETWPNWRKGIAAVLAAVGVIASSGLLSGTVEAWTNTAIAAVGAALVILLPNGLGESEDAAG